MLKFKLLCAYRTAPCLLETPAQANEPQKQIALFLALGSATQTRMSGCSVTSTDAERKMVAQCTTVPSPRYFACRKTCCFTSWESPQSGPLLTHQTCRMALKKGVPLPTKSTAFTNGHILPTCLSPKMSTVCLSLPSSCNISHALSPFLSGSSLCQADQTSSSSGSKLNMTLMAPVCAARAAQSNAAWTSFSEKPKRWVIMGATSTRLLSISFRQSGYVLA